MNFIISPGQDNVLLDNELKDFKGGYAHIYLYDYFMLSTILKKLKEIWTQQLKKCESLCTCKVYLQNGKI